MNYIVIRTSMIFLTPGDICRVSYCLLEEFYTYKMKARDEEKGWILGCRPCSVSMLIAGVKTTCK